ncbi:uncharacterized protein LOC135344833 [Halichondria panicea]|uniref:uncharacterized protein LOC135344833 n=1 Tax=Halichondria panicea TaxID=6063 RepID=UPI00312BC64D
MIIVDILVLDEDDMMMMMDDSSCKFSIEITVQDRSNCAEESSIVRISNAQLEGFFAVTLTLNIHVTDFNSDSSILIQIATPIVRILNSVCPQDCNRCGMGGSCNSYLQFCQEFSVSDIELYDAPKAGLSRLVKRAIPTTTTQNTTVINLVLRHPTGSPLSGIVALVPPFTSLSALNDALQTIQNTTGITIFDTDALINSSNIIMTTFFAHIVLPIMIILFVLILAIGVIIILIVGRKRKNNRKKSKIRPLIGSTSS